MNLTFSDKPWANLALWGTLAVAITALIGCERSTADGRAAFTGAIKDMEQRTGGVIGVYAIDTGTGRELTHRADERFAMASTFKPLLVAAVLSDVDESRLALPDTFGIEDVQILSYSPVIDELEDGQEISLAELCEATITMGDNTAANMLLELVGGPDGLTQFLRHRGDDVTRLDRYELELNTNTRGDQRDTTTPRAMITTVLHLLLSDTLSDPSKKLLQDWLVASKTGSTRLRAGLPGHWRIGDKTGTGMNGAANNFAVAWPPGRQPIAIAVYMSWSEMDAAALSAYHSEIAALVVKTFE